MFGFCVNLPRIDRASHSAEDTQNCGTNWLQYIAVATRLQKSHKCIELMVAIYDL